ncbi:MFS transporter [Streptomyces sp. 846.5]|nr:MFS transporter [Streptomyces sp. 846.5]TDT97562.1 MFS transporter [Streptomyces sp. 846.5]
MTDVAHRPAAGAPPEAPPPALRRNRAFRLIWLGSAFSLLGLEAADVAYPLVVLGLTGSPGWAGLFGAVQLTASLLAGLPVGELLDRHHLPRLLAAAEGLRLLATTSVAAALALHGLTLVHLLVVAGVLGLVQPLSGGARMVALRAAVPKEQLTAALTADEVRSGAAALAGPSLGGFLFGVARMLPFVATAGFFLVSTLTAVFLRLPQKEPAGPGTGGAQRYRTRLFAGVGALWQDVTVRGTVLLVAVLNAAGAPLVLVTLVVLRTQGAAAWQMGLVMAAMALGGLAGAVLVRPLHGRLRPGVLLLGLGVVEAAMFALLTLGWGPGWVAAVLFCSMLPVPALRVLVDVLIFRQVPAELRGRVIAGVMTLFTLGAPAGVALSGLLLQTLPPRDALLVLAAVVAVTVLVALRSRTLRAARWPQDDGH